MNLRFRCVVLILAMIQSSTIFAQSDLPFVHGMFADDMMLQRDVPCPIWGWTKAGQQVTVTMGDQTVRSEADAEGKWLVHVGPMPAGGPHTIQIKALQVVTLNNVLFGDIWICSGQSNMSMGISGVNQFWNELPSSPLDGVRLCWLKVDSQDKPQQSIASHWQVASNDSLLSIKRPYLTTGFTALGWFFAREVYKQTQVPIGIIECAQGNTAIESWSTVKSLRQFPELGKDLQSLQYYKMKINQWAMSSDPAYEQTRAWKMPDFDDSRWPLMNLPADWRENGLAGFNGLVWFRYAFDLPPSWAGEELLLNLGQIKTQATTWVNGEFVGAADTDPYRDEHQFPIPASVLKPGKNVIAVRVLGNRGFVSNARTMTINQLGNDAASLPISGPWKYQASTLASKLAGRKRQFDRIWMPGGLYNGMVAPMAPMAIKGFLWYQGEGNAGQKSYGEKLATMIRDWRDVFKQGDLPFYIVQLSAFGPMPDTPGNSSWALTRELQALVARSVPNCGLAVSIDRGEIFDIHPPNKRDVGNRLAAIACARAYQKNVACEGPTFKSASLQGQSMRITFDHAEGLKSLGAGPTGFAIAGADRRFYWANAILDGQDVLVSSPKVIVPVAVRYGWADHPLCNLYNLENFPAVPFRTDDW